MLQNIIKKLSKIKEFFKKFKLPKFFTKKRLIIFIFIVGIGYFVYTLTPMGKSDFLGLTKVELNIKVDTDFKKLRIYLNGMKEVMSDIEKNKHLFEIETLDNLHPDQKEKLIQLWASYLDHQVELSKLVDDYKYFYQINYLVDKELHSKAFLVGYTAFVTSYARGVQFIDYTFDKKLFETLFNDSYPEYGIPKNTYDRLKLNVLHINDVVRLTAGYSNLHFLYSEYEKLGFTNQYTDVFEHIEKDYALSTKNLKDKSVKQFAKNTIDIFKKTTYTVWFPIQKNVANALGNTRVTVRHENFITEAQIVKMKKSMEPGDIMIQRRNWYTSNVGIPGFWPHAALYLGNLEELKEYFNDPSVIEYIKSQGFNDLTGILSKTNEKFYDQFKTGEVDVIEAIAEGVVLQPLTKSAKADYVGVLRPRLSKLEKFKSILSAASHFGKPYDYNFNFITDSELVCSELVYKSFKSKINITLFPYLGKEIISPTQFVKKFDQEFGTPLQDLDFVYFLDGSEEAKRASVSDLESFRQTRYRTKWSFSQE